MISRIKLNNIAIILSHTQIPENIGASARAMNNMGLSQLILVNPKNYDLNRIHKTATSASLNIIRELQIYDDLEEAIGNFQYVVGSTARIGANRPAQTRPRQLARQLISISENNKVALLFGREDCGLSNEELRYCHTIVSIPTIKFSSLNLAHAVLILCYELSLASTDIELKSIPRLANKFELEGMYGHLKELCTKIGFIDIQNPEHWMNNIRRFLSRLPLRAKEVRIIRGLCRQIDWYTGQYQRSKQEDKKNNV